MLFILVSTSPSQQGGCLMPHSPRSPRSPRPGWTSPRQSISGCASPTLPRSGSTTPRRGISGCTSPTLPRSGSTTPRRGSLDPLTLDIKQKEVLEKIAALDKERSNENLSKDGSIHALSNSVPIPPIGCRRGSLPHNIKMGENGGSHASGQGVGSPGKVPQIIMTQFSHISEGGDSDEEEDECDGVFNIKPDYTEEGDELEIHEAFDDEDQESDDEVTYFIGYIPSEAVILLCLIGFYL